MMVYRVTRGSEPADSPLPVPAHEFDPAGRDANHPRAEVRCKCGLPRRNRIHQVLPVPGLERR